MEQNPEIASSSHRLTPAEWALAAEQFELGYANCTNLAAAFGISRQAMAKGLRRSGAIKGSRVHETVEKLNRALDERDRLRSQRAADRSRNLRAWLSSVLADMERTCLATS